MKEFFKKKPVRITIKVILTIISLIASFYGGVIALLMISLNGYWPFLGFLPIGIFAITLLSFIWLKKKKTAFLISLCMILCFGILFGTNVGINAYQESLIIDTNPNINIEEYLPFVKDTKIVKIDNASLKIEDDLPIIDGAAAVFPVYSSFVYSVYPEGTKLKADGYYYDEDIMNKHMAKDSVFQYNNTSTGYKLLGEKETDIFFGAYPSEKQIETAESKGTKFEYTQIGTEAFVFFVNKNNPITNLSTQQIKDIYSGKITNWKEVGGKDEEIVAFQRNEGSGSQSMLKRFMGDTPIMEAPTEQINDFMGGIINDVADFRNKSNSIGFSFRFYVEGIIKNPDIKMISIDGVAPTVDNIKNGTYSVTTPLYAVTYEGNDNENVSKLLDWILSDEGQKIIEETGYVGIK